MNTKKLFYGFLTIAILTFSACSNDSGDGLYEGVDKGKVVVPGRNSVDKGKIKVPGREETESVDKTKIIINDD